MSKKVGLYFGSFDPIHIGHLIIANYMANYTDLDQVWFVVSPLNPLKKHRHLIADQHRLQMVYLAIRDNEKLFASNVEFDMPKPSYTIDTLEVLAQESAATDNARCSAGNPAARWKETVAPTTPSITSAESAMTVALRRLGDRRVCSGTAESG